MAKRNNKNGFSLTEVLLAIGVLAVGMILVAGVFPVAIHFSTVSTERMIASAVADEAFATIQLIACGDLDGDADPTDDKDDDIFGADASSYLSQNSHTLFCAPDLENDIEEIFPFLDILDNIDYSRFTYPSVEDIKDPPLYVYPSILDPQNNQYCWTAICRALDNYNSGDPVPSVQVTVFVCRKTGGGKTYYQPDASGQADTSLPFYELPLAVKVATSKESDYELKITDSAERKFINDGCHIVTDKDGDIYRVVERYRDPDDDVILLDRKWEGGDEDVWVVPPPVNGGRYPCIAIYQRTIRLGSL